ncbi:MAG TPA: hypothetical protein DCR40_00970 [Prolixibacteraceae bacterium]|nr:hypothetical protein [Prolixibacteraceae bacterium]
MSKTVLTIRNLNFKRDTNKYLFQKYFDQKYFDYKDEIIDVIIYRDEKRSKRVLTTKKSKV